MIFFHFLDTHTILSKCDRACSNAHLYCPASNMFYAPCMQNISALCTSHEERMILPAHAIAIKFAYRNQTHENKQNLPFHISFALYSQSSRTIDLFICSHGSGKNPNGVFRSTFFFQLTIVADDWLIHLLTSLFVKSVHHPICNYVSALCAPYFCSLSGDHHCGQLAHSYARFCCRANRCTIRFGDFWSLYVSHLLTRHMHRLLCRHAARNHFSLFDVPSARHFVCRACLEAPYAHSLLYWPAPACTFNSFSALVLTLLEPVRSMFCSLYCGPISAPPELATRNSHLLSY